MVDDRRVARDAIVAARQRCPLGRSGHTLGSAVGIVGREDELEAVAASLRRLAGGPVAVVLEGEAGIGKTTIWRSGVKHAEAAGLAVLAAAPSEAERDLSFAGLAD